MSAITRRGFLKGSAALLAAGGLTHGRVLGANDELRIGVIGVGSTIKIGGKGKQDIVAWRKIKGVRVVAICDVDPAILAAEAEQFKKWGEKVDTYSDMRKMLERGDIDAVNVTTPNHWHALATIWACQAGKDVFVQKPASHNIFEGRKMVEAAHAHGRIVLCTSGSREPNGYREALAWVREGNLGKIQLIYGINYKARPSIGKVAGEQALPKGLDYNLWSGPAPVQPLRREFLHYDWHWDWLTGNGDLGNMGIHNLDGCRMATGQGLPRHAIGLGGRFGYDDDGQTPNTQLIYYDYEPAPVLFDVRGLPRDKSLLKGEWKTGDMDELHGERTSVIVYCEGGYVTKGKAFDKDGKLIKEFKPEAPGLNENFVQAVKSRKESDLLATIEDGHLSAALIHMGNISYRLGKTAPAGEIAERIRGEKPLVEALAKMYDHLDKCGIDLGKAPPTLGPMVTMDAKTEKFVGEFSEAANKLATREYREPFVVREKA